MTAKSTSDAVTPTAKAKSAKNTKPMAGTKPVRSSTKAVSTRPVAAKSTALKAKPAMTASTDATHEAEVPDMPKKELVQRMVEETGMKAGEARRALDAALTVLASGLREGADISAAPLGKIRIVRSKETANGDLVICRIKLKDVQPQTEGKPAVEKDEE